MELIQFAFADYLGASLDSSEYFKALIIDLSSKGLLSDYEVFEEIEISNYILKSRDNSFTFDTSLLFETYDSIKELEVTISSNNYDISHDTNEYLTKLKIAIKNFRRKEWKKCLWFYDIESENYAKKLYAKIHTTENLMRRFINDVMIKHYGSEWFLKMGTIKLTEKLARVSEYKAIAPTYANVDESLILLETADLDKIMHLEIRKMKSSVDDRLIDVLNQKRIPASTNGFYDIIKDNSEVIIDVWNECFDKYLSHDFNTTFKLFSSNRNHVAHNKLIDKNAYNKIKENIDALYKEISNAIKLFSADVISKEAKDFLEEQKAIEETLYQEYLNDYMENSSGVKIRNDNGILDMLQETISDLFSEIRDFYRFRDDIEFDDHDDQLTINYKLGVETTINVSYDVCDEQGSTSTAYIKVEHEGDEDITFSLEYINGEVEWNDDQSYYMPITEDGITNYNEILEALIDVTDKNCPNIKDLIDTKMYSIIKSGGSNPYLDDACEECGEEYVCATNEFAEQGTCVNCGHHNDVYECERCGKLVIDVRHIGDIEVCEECYDRFEAE